MKTKLTLISFTIGAALVLTGCGSNSTSGTNTAATTTNNQNSTQEMYLAYSPTRLTNDELWKSDGTSVNTGQISNTMSAGTIVQDQSLQIQEVYQVGNYLYSWARYTDDTNSNFLNPFPTGYNKLYQTDITNNTTTQVSGVYKDLSDAFLRFGGLKHFTASNGNTFIFNRDGTDNMKSKLTRINPDGTITDIPQPTGGMHLYPWIGAYFQDGDILYVEASDGTNTSLYSIDLSSNAPSWMIVPEFGTHNYATMDLYKVNNKIYTFKGGNVAQDSNLSVAVLGSNQTDITGVSSGIGYEPVWKNILNEHPYLIDGTSLYIPMVHFASGNRGLYKIDTSTDTITFLGGTYTNMGACYGIFSFQGDIYYLGNALGGVLKLYKYSSGTMTVVTTIPEYIDGMAIVFNGVYIANNKLYYAKSDNTHGMELWSYDGTTEQFEVDINPGAGDSRPTRITELNGKIVFQASQDGINNKLLSWDGVTLTPLN